MSTDPKPPIHWDWIETQWQRGTLSNYQIAKLHAEEFGREVAESSIRLRASQYGWQRDLSEAIRRTARAKIARGEGLLRDTAQETARAVDAQSVLSGPLLADEIEAEEVRVIERAAEALVEIDARHRRRVAQCEVVAGQLLVYASSKMPLDTDGTPKLDYEPGELRDVAAVVKQSIEANARAVELERKVYGMEPVKDGVANGSGLTDDERVARVATLLERARARGTGQPAEG